MVSRAAAISSSSASKNAWSCRTSSRLPFECWLPVSASMVERPPGSGSTLLGSILVGRWQRADHSMTASRTTSSHPLTISRESPQGQREHDQERVARIVPLTWPRARAVCARLR